MSESYNYTSVCVADLIDFHKVNFIYLFGYTGL